MNINKKISESINSGVNVIIARFLAIVFAVIVVVSVLSYTGIFLTTLAQMNVLLLSAVPSAFYGLLVLCWKRLRSDCRTKYVLCILMCFQAFAVAMAGYSYVGTIILLLPILLSALYPKSRVGGVVSAVMILCGIIIPPLALVGGFWDGGYFEFLYDLTYGRQMDTAVLSDVMLSQQEQIISALRFCSSQNVLIVGGFALIGRLIYRQANKSFESQKAVLRLSETDELTGLYNRNCFERRLNETSFFNTSGLACFYFDVNGLHEMNNIKGHKAGDIMLQFVGKKIQEVFGEDNAFRVGGDEYVAFFRTKKPDGTKGPDPFATVNGMEGPDPFATVNGTEVPDPLATVKESLEKTFALQGYYVAIGYAKSDETADVNELLQMAEKEMYQAKDKYYETHNESFKR